MKYALIENGVVVNVIAAQAEFAKTLGAIELQPGFGIGDLYQNGTYVRKEIPQEEEEDPERYVPTIEERTAALEEAMLLVMEGNADV